MYISLDIGGTHARIGSFKKLKGILNSSVKQELSHNLENDLDKIYSAIAEQAGDHKILGISIGLPGRIEPGKGMSASNNLKEWVSVDVAKIFSEKYDCETLIENDAIMASLGEKYYGKLLSGNFVYITWGTGIGCSHVRINCSDVIAQKINRPKYLDSFENNCGGTHLDKRFGIPISEMTDVHWDEVMKDAQKYIKKIADGLKEGQFIISGGVAQKQELRIRIMRERLKSSHIDLSLSDLGDDAGLYGGLALFR